MNNPWINYFNRSYSSIKQALITKLTVQTPEMTDLSESNPLIILISMFAGLMTQLGYYIDNMALEAFVVKAKRYTSLVSHAKLFDYRIKSAIPSNADLTITLYNTDILTPIGSNLTIPSGTIFATNNDIRFLLLNDYIMLAGESTFNLTVSQVTSNTGLDLGFTNGNINQIFALPTNYAHDSAVLLIQGILWELRTTLGRSNAFDKHYIIDVSEDRIPYIKFGDNTNGLIPTSGETVILNYNETEGSNGNVDPGTITNWLAQPTIAGIDEIKTTNTNKSSNGDNIQSLTLIQSSLPLSIRTLDRAVSKQDYIDTSKLAPGVKYADVFWECGKIIDIYVAPIDGGIAALGLLQSTKTYVDFRKMYTTEIRVSPSGETLIILEMNITANNYVESLSCEAAVRLALLNKYDFDGSNVNRKVRLSDIYSAVDNLPEVDFLDITKLTTQAYARPTLHLLQLNGVIITQPNSTTRQEWRLAYDGTTFRLLKDNLFITQIEIDIPYINNDISIIISNSTYTSGMEWIFISYPYNENIEFDDFTVPILNSENLIMNITTTP